MSGASLMVYVLCFVFVIDKVVDASKNGDLPSTGFNINLLKDVEASRPRARRSVTQSPTDDEIQELFSIYDISGDGQISPSELNTTVARFAAPLSSDEVQQIFNEYDTDNNAYVDYKEFAFMMRNDNRK